MARGHIYYGIDPGSTVTGYGVIRTVNNTVKWEDSGVIVPKPNISLDAKLEYIYDTLLSTMNRFEPGFVCIEQAFYAKNVHTTLILGHARGVAFLAARKAGAVVVEYSPREIKKSVVGNGNASKDQVMYMIKMLLAPPEKTCKPDACDALAAALCAYYHHGNQSKGIH